MPDRWMKKYLKNALISLKIQIVPSLFISAPLDSVGAALLLSEAYQREGRLQDAIDIFEGLDDLGIDPDIAALALAELYLESNQPDEVLRVTDGITNADDVTMRAMVFRAAAL
jgi:tetratricopeptide (TPR) repeat protein